MISEAVGQLNSNQTAIGSSSAGDGYIVVHIACSGPVGNR